MVNKKTKNKPEFKCCGEECSCQGKKLEVYVCPRCQAVDVGYKFGLTNLLGLIPRMKCNKCGFESMTFPKWIIDKERINKKSSALKKSGISDKKKTKFTGFDSEVLESYCPNCEDKVEVTMKDGSIDTFVCENCKFEIKNKVKKK